VTKLNSALALPSDEAIVLGKKYNIILVDTVKTEVQKWEGVRVQLASSLTDVIAIMLWIGETVSGTSKLGAFIGALGDETDQWRGKNIKFVRWTEKNRKIEVLPNEDVVPDLKEKSKSNEKKKDK